MVSGAGEWEWGGSEAEPTEAKPVRGGGDSADDVGMLAQPVFLKPVGLDSAEGATGAKAVVLDVGFAILTPAAAAILRNSFSSRFRSFSLRLSCSSGVFCLAR